VSTGTGTCASDDELRGFELKGPGSREDAHFFAKVTRAALGLANLRDGGHVIVGIDEVDPAAMGPGLDADDLVHGRPTQSPRWGNLHLAWPPHSVRVQRTTSNAVTS